MDRVAIAPTLEAVGPLLAHEAIKAARLHDEHFMAQLSFAAISRHGQVERFIRDMKSSLGERVRTIVHLVV